MVSEYHKGTDGTQLVLPTPRGMGRDNMNVCKRLKVLFKRVIYICVLFIILYAYYTIRTRNTLQSEKENVESDENFKYILQWTSPKTAPFDFMGVGPSAFIKNNCKYQNCFVTHDPKYFPDESYFDAVAFNGKNVFTLKDLPQFRSPKQKFIYAAMESAHNYPICNSKLDNYFNWTWTYRLDSDFRWGYITIYDLNGTVVGPKIDMKWPASLDPISDELKLKLDSKTKAVAWFVSNCHTRSRRETFAYRVNNELKKYGWSVDIYGKCGNYSCPRNHRQICFRMLEKDYHFYFSLENSFAEDYVTEKLLTALNNYAVPIIFGGANYSRFLPPGSYLNGRQLGAESLSKIINEVMTNRSLYYDYFRWRNHYVYKETSDNADICSLCEAMNDEKKVNQYSLHENISRWWNPGVTSAEDACKSRRY